MRAIIAGIVQAVLEFLFGRADNATTTITHEKTPDKIAAANESDYDKWLREHKGS